MSALRRRAGLRFLAEAVLIVLVTVVTGVLHLGPWGIGGAAAIVWLTYVVIEYSLAHPREEKQAVAPLVESLPEPEPALPRSESVRVIARTPAPEPEPVALEREPEPVAVEAEPEPEPEPTPEREAVSDTELAPDLSPSVSVSDTSTHPRRWNVWELERALRATGEPSEEREFLLIYLRDYAGPDGLLPLDFDDLVRESFSDVVGTPTG